MKYHYFLWKLETAFRRITECLKRTFCLHKDSPFRAFNTGEVKATRRSKHPVYQLDFLCEKCGRVKTTYTTYLGD